MGYELTLFLKRGTLEIEFDTVDELEEKLAGLDVARVEAAVAKATARRKGAAKTARAKPAGPKAKKPKGATGRRKA